MNYAILSAVSKKEQASADKVSLDAQENQSRQLGLSRGWVETAGPFRIPGASRSFYVNLSDAETDIPQLSLMLNAARERRFDVLIFFSYDRLGDLADMIAVALRFYGVQLLSVSQGTEVQDPLKFDPYASDSEVNMRIMAKMTQQFRIADMRRKFRSGMEKRVNEGLNSVRLPYAYTKPAWDKKAIAAPTESARHVVEMKDLFLHGRQYREIARHFNERGIPSPHGVQWNHTAVRKILDNPFYAGKVFFGRSRVSRDVRLGKVTIVPNPQPLIRDGKHQALYNWETYQAIKAEMERRDSLPPNNRFQFSGMLVCSVCEKHMNHNRGHWRCRHHFGISDHEALALIPPAIQKALVTADPSSPNPPAPKADSASDLADLTRQRRRIQQAYEAEVYTLDEAQKKMKDIDSKIAAIADDENAVLRRQASHHTFLETLESARLVISDLPRWIAHDNPVQVNLLLRRLFSHILITPDLQITPVFLE